MPRTSSQSTRSIGRIARTGWLGSLIVASVLVTLFLITTILQFIIPLSIIGFIWALNPSASGWMVLATVGLSLAAIVVTEFGFELPLCRLWGLPYGKQVHPDEKTSVRSLKITTPGPSPLIRSERPVTVWRRGTRERCVLKPAKPASGRWWKT